MNTQGTFWQQDEDLLVLDTPFSGEEYETEQRSAGYEEDFDKAWAEGVTLDEFQRQMHEIIDGWEKEKDERIYEKRSNPF
jgi:hypothetical protein